MKAGKNHKMLMRLKSDFFEERKLMLFMLALTAQSMAPVTY